MGLSESILEVADDMQKMIDDNNDDRGDYPAVPTAMMIAFPVMLRAVIKAAGPHVRALGDEDFKTVQRVVQAEMRGQLAAEKIAHPETIVRRCRCGEIMNRKVDGGFDACPKCGLT